MTPAERFLRERLDDEEIVVDLEAGRFFGLNESAVAVLDAWRTGLRDPVAIAERLAETFDVSPAAIAPEVAAFLEDARARGLIDA